MQAKYGGTHKHCSPVDSKTWAQLFWLTEPVQTLDVIYSPYREQWMIGMDGVNESKESILSAWLDVDNDDIKVILLLEVNKKIKIMCVNTLL